MDWRPYIRQFQSYRDRQRHKNDQPKPNTLLVKFNRIIRTLCLVALV